MKSLIFALALAAFTPSIFAADGEQPAAEPKPITHSFTTGDGKYQFTTDTTVAPDLTEWTEKELQPIIQKWYPKLVEMLPSEGYSAPTNVTLKYRTDMKGTPASAGGGRVNLNADWFRKNLKGEAAGSVIHELIHVVQNYGQARRNNPDAKRTPGWIVEGIPDYIRWFIYEPEKHGAEITARNLERAKYDASYRVTGNFLNWATLKYDKNLAQKLNAAARQGKYEEQLWKDYTGKTIQELGDEWKQEHTVRLAANSPAGSKASTEGWKNLFNGKDLTGWHNFRTNTVRAGWQVKDGTLACVDPHNAGDLCTEEKFDWFELQLEYNISPGGNSGIMYHVTEEARSAWATGPEIQLEDNKAAQDPQRCGWLYGLYKPADDPATGKPLDATKPAGEWNTMRVIISPEKCEHYVNGVKYFDYVLGSDDFKERVAKSKFGSMPRFAKSDTGFLVLQGDHGEVAFRNIKIRSLPGKK
jgi:hypothetical protein